MCPFCGKLLSQTATPDAPVNRQPLPARASELKPDLRAIFPLLNDQGEPLLRRARPAQAPEGAKNSSGEETGQVPFAAELPPSIWFQYRRR
jgi:hypothetical protein